MVLAKNMYLFVSCFTTYAIQAVQKESYSLLLLFYKERHSYVHASASSNNS
jgi:hypothetical protein